VIHDRLPFLDSRGRNLSPPGGDTVLVHRARGASVGPCCGEDVDKRLTFDLRADPPCSWHNSQFALGELGKAMIRGRASGAGEAVQALVLAADVDRMVAAIQVSQLDDRHGIVLWRDRS